LIFLHEVNISLSFVFWVERDWWWKEWCFGTIQFIINWFSLKK
jgi:hypothetical protein